MRIKTFEAHGDGFAVRRLDTASIVGCQFIGCVSTCVVLSARQKREPFLHRLVMGDEKWVVYNNVTRKRHWVILGQAPLTTSNAEIAEIAEGYKNE